MVFEPLSLSATRRREIIETNAKKLDVSTLEGWLWEAACVIRGPIDAPKFKDYILPIIFLKRLSDKFEDEVRNGKLFRALLRAYLT